MLPEKLSFGDQLRAVVVNVINAIIDHLNSTRLVAGSGIKIDHYPSGLVISALPQGYTGGGGGGGGGGAAASYNGYFTLKDVSTYNEDGSVNENRVAVCDGETWDPKMQTSGPMLMRVNYSTVKVPCCVVSDFTQGQDHYIYLVYTNSTRQIVFQASSVLQSDNFDVYYYLIGEFSRYGTIIQRHTTGIGNGEAQIWPITLSCGV